MSQAPSNGNRDTDDVNHMYADIITQEVAPELSTLTSTGKKRANQRPLFNFNNASAGYLHNRPDPLSTCVLSPLSQSMLRQPKKAIRFISRTPYKVLDAPELQDDFYLNLVDWSSTNHLGVGLGACVYSWSAANSKVTKLFQLTGGDKVASVSWAPEVPNSR